MVVRVLSFHPVPREWFVPYFLVRPDYTLFPTPFGVIKFLVPGAVPFGILVLAQLLIVWLIVKLVRWAWEKARAARTTPTPPAAAEESKAKSPTKAKPAASAKSPKAAPARGRSPAPRKRRTAASKKKVDDKPAAPRRRSTRTRNKRK